MATEASRTEIHIKHVDGLVGAQSRSFSNARIHSWGLKAKVFLREEVHFTYPRIDTQVKIARETE